MKDQDKTKGQLIDELAELRQRVAELEAAKTEWVQVEETLRESELRFRSLIEQTTDAVFCYEFDPPIPTDLPIEEQVRRMYSSVLVECNDVCARSYGATRGEEVVGKKLTELFGTSPGSLDGLFTAVVQGGYRIVNGEGVEVLEDGTKRYFLNNGHGVVEDGQLVRMWGTYRDITERKRAEETLRIEKEFTDTALDAQLDTFFLFEPATGKAVRWNRAFRDISGYSDEEIARVPAPASYYSPEDLERAGAFIQKVLEKGTGTIELELICKDSRKIPTEYRVSAINDDQGEPKYIISIGRDITERVRAEEALRESEVKYRTLFETMAQGVVYQSGDGKITSANPAAERILGLTFDQMQGRTSMDPRWKAIQEDGTDFPGDVHPAMVALRTGKEVRNVVMGVFNPGKEDYTWININAVPQFKSGEEKPYQVYATFEDITERRRTEIELQQLASVVRHTSELVNLATLEGQMIFINEAGGEMLGIDPEQVKQHVIFQVIPEHLLSKVRQEVVPSIIEKGGWEGELQYLNIKTNELTDVYAITFIVTDPNTGAPLYLANVSHDITERKLMEEERERLLAQIREQAQRMQHILDTVPEGVLLLDADEQIILVNPVAERELVALSDARTGDTLTHLGDRPLAELLTSPPKGLWHEVAMDDRNFQVIARPVENGPTPAGWVLVVRDVTQQREIQLRVQQQERLAVVGQLAAGIAHDFNNIMATVVLYAQMTARMEGLPATVRQRMETIDGQAKHATRLIQQILDFSRRAVLERRPLDLAMLLKEHVVLLERTLPESIEIKLDIELDAYTTPCTVNADPTRMQQMVTNLALNAREAMPRGGGLRIGLERIVIQPGESPLLPEMEPGEWVKVTVSDTGTGIPPDALPHIFEPFFTTRAPLGSGLGLAQVHGIVGAHEGRIDVETRVGKGTTFTIYLPVHRSEPSPALSRTELPALPTGQGETILVVEDDAVVRRALADSLELLNYQVLEVSDGQEALETLEERQEEVALVLSDVVMPKMSGTALLHALRERGLPVQVVMLTGHPIKREMEELRTQGMIDWLPKPPELEQLAKVVARALATD